MNLAIRYLLDAQVDDDMDIHLCGLLHACFSEHGVETFKLKRYYHELPKHRWIIEDKGELVAHLAAHEKTFTHEGKEHAFLGIAEVCVAKTHRGHGLVKAMLKQLEKDFPSFNYAILLGDKGVYGSSGYKAASNVYFPDISTEASEDVMVKCFNSFTWPTGNIEIEGKSF